MYYYDKICYNLSGDFMDVIVVGGGASGMTAAINSKRCGNNVTIIEKNNILGKKLLLTGNGRCNYYNDNMNINNFYSNKDVSRFVNEDNLNKVKELFDSVGIIPRIKDGYYYPYSNISNAIQNSLLTEINNLNIKIINEEVIDIDKNNKFIIKTNNNYYECDKLILSTGGITYPKTGSDGFGYKILKKFNHNIITPKPALVPLISNENVKEWKGIRVNSNIKLYINNKFITEEAGEIQLTDYGISGICIMNLSRFINKENKNTIVIDFIPNINNLLEFINNRNKKLLNRNIIELLECLLNYKLLYFILRKIHINPDNNWDNLTNKEKELLVNSLKSYKLNIIDTKDENYGETTCGGVDLDEINNNCESKKVNNLFITGEILDIDGKCGGYNLTIAWITGILAGEK